MQHISADFAHALHNVAATRALEATAASGLPAHCLMQRAGAATARLALALAPHARQIWIACGSGNNGGDGLEAAALLHQGGSNVTVTWLGQPDTTPADARAAWQRAVAAGVVFAPGPPADLGPRDLCIDAVLGIGLSAASARLPAPALRALLDQLRASPATLLAIDLPSGLDADTGQYAPGFAPDSTPTAPCHTLSLLTLHGISFDDKQVVSIKNLYKHKDLFVDNTRKQLFVATPGTSNPDWLALPFKRLQRPIWPLDEDPLGLD